MKIDHRWDQWTYSDAFFKNDSDDFGEAAGRPDPELAGAALGDMTFLAAPPMDADDFFHIFLAGAIMGEPPGDIIGGIIGGIAAVAATAANIRTTPRTTAWDAILFDFFFFFFELKALE